MKDARAWQLLRPAPTDAGSWKLYAGAGVIVFISLVMLWLGAWGTAAIGFAVAAWIGYHPWLRRTWYWVGYYQGYDDCYHQDRGLEG